MEAEEIKTSVSDERINLFEKNIEEKNQRNRRNFSFRLTIYLIIMFCLCLSPFLPVFSCRNSKVNGTYHLTLNELLGYASYKERTPLLFVNEDRLEAKILEKEYIASARVEWHLLGLEINVDEIACVLRKNGEVEGTYDYLLTNGETLSEFKKEHPTSTYDFKENETPLLISDFSFENADDIANNNVEQAYKRKQKLFKNLKEIAPSVLKQANYFDIVYDKNGETLLFGFYFPFEENNYLRILLRDESFAYFLDERRLLQIVNALKAIDNSEKKLYKHDTMNELMYYNTVCMYDGKENSCRLL